MSSKVTITEPHPTVPIGSYTHSGRGGAGNTFRASESPSSTSRSAKAPRSSRAFYSGIGGAGNAHRAGERAVLNFDEEFDRARVRDSATATHVGVGGAGNVFRKAGSSVSSGSSVHSSQSLTGSHGFWGRKSSSSARQ